MATIYIRNNMIQISVNVDGKQYRKSTGLKNTRANKKKVEEEILPKFMAKITEPTKDIILDHYIDKFLEEKKHTVKEKTYSRYKDTIDKWIRPTYGKKKMSAIKASMLKEYINTQYNLGKSTKTIELYITIFSGIIQEAMYDEVLDSNPFKNIKKGKKKKPEITPFSPTEVNLLLEHSDGWLRNYIGIASHLGLRSGEMMGLKWNDITDSHIKIRRTRDRGRDTEPKTSSSIRDLPIFNSIKEFLDSQSKITGNMEYVFVSKFNEPWCHSGSICQYHWYPLLDKLGLKRRRIYELRHTFATNMLNSGYFKVTEIAHLMGHTTTEYLFNVYSKYIESEKNSIPLDKSIY